MIYLDSSTLIAVIKDEPGCEPVEAVLAKADRQELAIYCSPLTLVEVRGQGRGQQDPTIERQARAILAGARMTEVEFSRGVALRAREYVGRYHLKPADAIHLASAVEDQVDVMWVLDSDFERLWSTAVESVWVDRPYNFGQGELSFSTEAR